MTERGYAPTLSWYREWMNRHVNVTVWIGIFSLLAAAVLGTEIAPTLTISSQTVVVGFGAAALWSSSALCLLLLLYAHGKRQESNIR